MNADKITLSRRLHDLGVTREWEWNIDDLLCYNSACVGRVFEESDKYLWTSESPEYIRAFCYPIPGHDWLWAWLWKNGYRVVQVSDTIYDLEKENTRRGEDDWDWEHQIEAFSLHVALLTAAVWVAEKEAANGNRP